MRSLSKRLKAFRDSLNDIIIAHEHESNNSSNLVTAICKALRADFDTEFPEAFFSNDRKEWESLINTYCHKYPFCPICGATLIARKANAGHTFLGCSTFPSCFGARSSNTHKPSLNESLRIYLLEKHNLEKESENSRFVKIILDE